VPYDPALMRRVLNRRPSPAMVVACIALMVALGGTGYAAIKLPRNSVGNKQLRANAVTSGKVRNGSLTAKDFTPNALKRGPRGPQGPKGDSAPGAGGERTAVGFASRDAQAGGGVIAMSGTPTDLIGLGVPAGNVGYVASSGLVTASGPSRLIANAEPVMLNASVGATHVSCQLVLLAPQPRVIGTRVDSSIAASDSFVPVAVSAGTDVEGGTYDVRVQCYSPSTLVQFHRGNLTVAIAPRS